jgi:hypothetical protein
MRDDHLTELDARIRAVEHDLDTLTEHSLDQHYRTVLLGRLDGLCIARDLYTRPGVPARETHEVLAEAREGTLVRNDSPRYQEVIRFKRSLDHADTDLFIARVPSHGLSTTVRMTDGDLRALLRGARRALVNGEVSPA